MQFQLGSRAPLIVVLLITCLMGASCADRQMAPQRPVVGSRSFRTSGIDPERIGVQSWLWLPNERGDLVVGTGAKWGRLPLRWPPLLPASRTSPAAHLAS